jgi:hypothetical protein
MNSAKVKLTAFLTGLILILLSCEKEVPTVITTEITGIADYFATSGGTVTDEGSGPVIERGVCWNSTGYPMIDDDRTIDGNGTGVFTSYINSLTPESIYYVRAYATNSIGTGYGESLCFQTTLPIGDPWNPWFAK